MKTVEELNALKDEAKTLRNKLAGLSEEELEQIAGGEQGGERPACPYCSKTYPSYEALTYHCLIDHLIPGEVE